MNFDTIKHSITTLSVLPYQKLHPKILKIFLLIVSMIILIWAVVCIRWDNDSFWMIAQGRDILTNGIPYTDPFCILPDMSFVAQGWLFYIFISVFYDMGSIGTILFSIIIVGLSFTAGYTYLSQYKIRVEYKIFTVCCLMGFIQYSVLPRPNSITIVLLVFECIAFERFKHTKKWQWLLILPAGMILEANFHCSMIWFHFLVAAAYIVPSIWRKVYYTYNRSWRLPLFFTALMIPCMFINPYGLNGVLYLPRSILSNTFSYISVTEMNSDFWTVIILAVVIIMVFIPLLRQKTKCIYSHQVYLIIGFFILTIFAVRNLMFMFPALLTILAPFLRHLTLRDSEAKIYTSVLIWAVGVFFSILLVGGIITFTAEISSNSISVILSELNLDNGLLYADIYMGENSNKSDLKLFSGFNYGGYFEYEGYKNVYMDARPENRMKLLNGQRDELIEFSKYCKEGNASNEEIHSWIDDYGFDYCFVDKEMEPRLYKYLNTNNTEFSKILETDRCVLYERIQSSGIDSMSE